MDQQLSLIPQWLVDAADDGRAPRGLLYEPEFISRPEEQRLLSHIDAGVWLDDIARRSQHFGFKYDYSNRRIDKDSDLGLLPPWLADLEQRVRGSLADLVSEIDTQRPFDQAIVNEYQPVQGIAPHTDRDCFGPLVAMVSLGSDVNMDFIGEDRQPAFTQRLERRSVVALSGEARTHWRHGIAKRLSDRHLNSKILRTRRVSITLRTVL